MIYFKQTISDSTERGECLAYEKWPLVERWGERSTHLSNDDVGLEVVALSNRINNLNSGSKGARAAVLSQLFLPYVGPFISVVLPIDHGSRQVGRNIAYDVAPTATVNSSPVVSDLKRSTPDVPLPPIVGVRTPSVLNQVPPLAKFQLVSSTTEKNP